MIDRLKHFKEYYEKKRAAEKWRVFYKEELPEKVVEPRTIYFVITGDSIINKQKTIDFSIFYVDSRKQNGLLNFRKEINNFIFEDLTSEFETSDFYITDGCTIDYSISDDRKTLRIAEIKCTFDYTKLREKEEGHPKMEVLHNKFTVKE